MHYNDQNIFAKILRGEAPCIQVYENEHTLAFMDIMPQSEGHVLVISKEAAVDFLSLSPPAGHAALDTARRIAKAQKQALDVPGIFIAQMNGEAAGQTVPHYHIHVIPRHPDRPYRGHASDTADPAKLEATAAKIRAAFKK
jgi:histidine triad (HIT) family protein